MAEGTFFFAEDWFDPMDAGVRIRRAREKFARIRPFEHANELCARIVMDWPQGAYIFAAFRIKRAGVTRD